MNCINCLHYYLFLYFVFVFQFVVFIDNLKVWNLMFPNYWYCITRGYTCVNTRMLINWWNRAHDDIHLFAPWCSCFPHTFKHDTTLLYHFAGTCCSSVLWHLFYPLEFIPIMERSREQRPNWWRRTWNPRRSTYCQQRRITAVNQPKLANQSSAYHGKFIWRAVRNCILIDITSSCSVCGYICMCVYT